MDAGERRDHERREPGEAVQPALGSAERPVYVRAAPGSVQTIELTSKKWKGLLLIGALLAVAGIGSAALMVAREPRLLSHPSWVIVAALVGAGVGLVLMFIARVGAWWHHG